MPSHLGVALILTSTLSFSDGLDNGLAITPPLGWRSWNAYDCTRPDDIITDEAMRAAMRGVIDKSRTVDGKPTSLLDLGFGWVSMDDGWQQCNCSTRQDLDPTLPACSVDDCMFRGLCSWHDKQTGLPMVNKHRFSNMKSLVDYGHGLGLKVGSYLNNCICMEHTLPHYQQDVEWFLAMGFDEVKIDSCGSSSNVSHFTELFNSSGKAVRIENCHNGVPDPTTSSCPMNMYRTGGDISASLDSIIGEIYSTVPFNDRPDPQSRPGCWAYPDMLEIGNFDGAEPLRSHEEQSHFGLWCINSAPLILGFNMSDAPTFDRVWPTITNPLALAVNQEWAGHPGTLIKNYAAQNLSFLQVGQASCDGRPDSLGWQLVDGELHAPSSTFAEPVCLEGGSSLPYQCPPPTTSSGQVDCGNLIRNCSDVTGRWVYDINGLLLWYSQPTSDPQCLKTTLPALSQYQQVTFPLDKHTLTSRHQNRILASLSRSVGDGRRQPAITATEGCPQDRQTPPAEFTFSFTASKELRSGIGGSCITTTQVYGVQLWSKPLLKGRVAALYVNLLTVPQAVQVPIMDIPGFKQGCLNAYLVKDVWSRGESVVERDHLSLNLQPHQSTFVIIQCAQLLDNDLVV